MLSHIFGWLLFIYCTKHKIFLNISFHENVFITFVVYFLFLFHRLLLLCDGSMRHCSSVWEFKSISLAMKFWNKVHFIMNCLLAINVTVTRDIEMCSMNLGVACFLNVWAQVKNDLNLCVNLKHFGSIFYLSATRSGNDSDSFKMQPTHT